MAGISEAPPANAGGWLSVFGAGTLAFFAMLDMSVGTLAIPSVADGFDISVSAAQWVVLSGQLALVSLLLPVGNWLSGKDPRPLVLPAIVCFAVCSGLSALVPTFEWFVTIRTLQGAASAVILVSVPVLAARAVRAKARGRAMGIVVTMAPLGAVVGPVLGGALLDTWGWRAAFAISTPVCVVVLTWWRGRSGVRDSGTRRPDIFTTVVDSSLFTLAIGSFLLVLTFADDSLKWLFLMIPGALAVALWLRRPGGRTVQGTLGHARLWMIIAAALAMGSAFTAMRHLVSLHLQTDRAMSPTAVGFTVMWLSLAMAASGMVGGLLSDRFSARWVGTAGAVITTVGVTLVLAADHPWTSAALIWPLVVVGVGMGVYAAPTQALVLKDSPVGRQTTATAALQAGRNLGFTVGPPLATTAWTTSGGGPAGATAGLVIALLLASMVAILFVGRTGRTR
ncbi:MFS transporter [Lentzea pudingi]|uniref:MFS transporter n=1 Tax=Lentzea pudingi TaxID=1789439 RepID=A0ABQ2IWF5_9PSEU|nr:MFS transporter [Lentzea pudingi]